MVNPRRLTPSELPLIATDGCCHYCGGKECVRVSAVILEGERHFHYHCPRCSQVWLRAEQRPALPYQPPMVK
jgi:hypothetical protein